MRGIIALYNSFYVTKYLYWAIIAIAVLMASSFFVPPILDIATFLLAAVVIIFLIDVGMLYLKRRALLAARTCASRFSNGAINEVTIEIKNNYNFPISIFIIDELPFQFNKNLELPIVRISGAQNHIIEYNLKPTQRGEYNFGNILAFVQSPLNIVQRKFNFPANVTIHVYPSYSQLKQFSLNAIGNNLNQTGTKLLKKLGNSTEFEQIKEYIPGDDFRTINWKASARKASLMVNTYIDEKSQQVYCLVDKSRTMKMPFDGMTLLDYAINASLVLTNIAIQKQDKAGLLCFSQKVDNFITAEKNSLQMPTILDTLYKQQTNFLDASFENLYAQVRHRIKQRSLLILFTNFESKYNLDRQLPYLRKMAQHHLLLVVFFENTEIKKLHQKTAVNTEEIYIKTIADKFLYEKKLMAKELQQYGILCILTTPENLTIDAVNKYLEIKKRQAI